MNLANIAPHLSYRSSRDDLVRDFYNPCLEASILYRRSAGYFTSAGLALAARGVASLITAGGKMRLIASPDLGGTMDDESFNQESFFVQKELKRIAEPKGGTRVHLESVKIRQIAA